ncbi:hypothetical protein ACGE24_06525 [Corynebacterium kroppenstedtii]
MHPTDVILADHSPVDRCSPARCTNYRYWFSALLAVSPTAIVVGATSIFTIDAVGQRPCQRHHR